MPFEFVSDDHGGVTVMRDGHPQSHVQLDDPQLLAFEYIQHFAIAAALLPPGPVATTHIGGAGFTFARHLEATRPGSPQIVLEPDVELTDAVRRELPLPRGHRIRVRGVDGATGLKALRDNTAGLIVLDAYDGSRVPADLVTPAAWSAMSRVLQRSGLLLANIADEPDRGYLSRVLATAAHAFPHFALLATQDVMKRRRFGNYVIVASDRPIDVAALRREAARSPYPTAVRDEHETAALARSGAPFTETDVDASPEPPQLGKWRLR